MCGLWKGCGAVNVGSCFFFFLRGQERGICVCCVS